MSLTVAHVPEADSKTRGDEDPADPRPSELTKAPIGHYEIIRPLGQGGMSQVHLARDTRLGRKVALKFLLKIDAHHYARFAVEAQATAQLSHENIVALHDIGTHRGRPYMVLEYVPGKTLSAWLRERKADTSRTAGIPAQRAAELILPVARALLCAHEAGIVHRDLKPANIMLADNGTVKVLDFGIAKLLDDADAGLPEGGAPPAPAIGAAPEAIADPLEPLTSSDSTMTRTGTLLGTQPYMAPEQWRMEAVDGRADLWSIGIILYEMITGEHPLGSYSLEVLERVGALDEPMPKVRDRLPGLGKLGELIDRCLIKPKADRLGSARELCEALEAIARPHLGARSADGDELNPYSGLAAFQ
jgi:serine/threonine protein kinase